MIFSRISRQIPENSDVSRVSLFQSNLRKQIRNLPKTLNFVKKIQYYSKLFTSLLSRELASSDPNQGAKNFTIQGPPANRTSDREWEKKLYPYIFSPSLFSDNIICIPFLCFLSASGQLHRLSSSIPFRNLNVLAVHHEER